MPSLEIGIQKLNWYILLVVVVKKFLKWVAQNPPIRIFVFWKDIHQHQPTTFRNTRTEMSNEKKPGYFLYMGDYTTRPSYYRDFSQAIIRIPINQPGFNGK